MPTNARTVEACIESQSEIVSIASAADLQFLDLEAMFYARVSLPANRCPLSSCIELQERRRTHILAFGCASATSFLLSSFHRKVAEA